MLESIVSFCIYNRLNIQVTPAITMANHAHKFNQDIQARPGKYLLNGSPTVSPITVAL